MSESINILVVCSAGMSSSALVLKMRSFVSERSQFNYKIGACSSNQIESYIEYSDIVFLAPQLVYLEQKYHQEYPHKRILLINPEDYGNQNAEAILKSIEIEDEQYKDNKKPFYAVVVKITQYIGTNDILLSISSAMMLFMPLSFIGSLFTLFLNFPIKEIADWIIFIHLDELLQMGIDATLNSISIYISFLVACKYARRKKVPVSQAGINALMCFFLIVGVKDNAIDITYLGPQGLFCSFAVSIVATRCFIFCHKRNKKLIKNCEKIPTRIMESFTSVFPNLFSVILFLIIAFLFRLTPYQTFPRWIYESIQNTLSTIVGGNILSLLFLSFFTNFLWFFGIHGGSISGTIANPTFLPLSYANLAAYQSGLSLPYIVNNAFRYLFVMGGAGSTLSLAFMMAFFAKSNHMKKLGKLSLPMGIFFINEPILFGLPIVMNPILAFPFAIIPTMSALLTYWLTVLEILPRTIGYELPFTTPPIINGLIQGGWKMALWQIILLILQAIMWYPFFKFQDKLYLVKEKQK